jgi:hypothetical protein
VLWPFCFPANWSLVIAKIRRRHSFRNFVSSGEFNRRYYSMEGEMGRSILLWLVGVPIPIIILLAIFWH